MSIASALLGLGIALATVGGLGTLFGLAMIRATFTEYDTDAERRRAQIFFTIMVALLAVGGFLIGLTHPAVTE